PDHVLVDRHRHELAAVVDVEGEADELRQDGRTARPGLDRRAAALVLRSFRLLQQRKLDERTFPDGTGHGLTLLLRVTRPDDELVGRFVVTGTGTLGRLAPRSDRMTAARGAAFTAAVRVVDRVLGDTARQRAPALPAGADRHLADLHRVAGLHVDLLAGDHLVARRKALRSDDIGLLAGFVGHERDECRTVRIIFEPLDGRRHVPRAALEIDVAIFLLVTAGH